MNAEAIETVQRVAEGSAPPAQHPFEELLSRPDALLERIRSGRDLSALARTTVLTILLGAAIYGAAIGAYRGGLQILYAAVKLPLVLLFTSAATAPALTALGVALGRKSDLRRDIALVLAALSRTSLALAGLTPLVLLAIRRDSSYHDVILLLVATSAVAGALGLAFFFRGLRRLEREAAITTGLSLVTVFVLVGSQMAWTLRPYLVRPRAPEVVFVRQIEGTFLDSVRGSARSAAGIYDRESAPLSNSREGEF